MAFLSSYSALFTAGLLEHCDRAPLRAALANAGPRRHTDSRRSSLPTTSSSSSKGSGSNRSGRHSSHLRSFLSLDISESIRTRDSTVSMFDVRSDLADIPPLPTLPTVDSSRLSTSFIHSPTHSRTTSLRSNASRALPEAKPAPMTPPPPSPGVAVFHHLPPSPPVPSSPRSTRGAAKPASLSLPSPKGSFDSLRSAPEFSTPFDLETSSPTYSIFFPLTDTAHKSFSLNPLPIKSKHTASQLIGDDDDLDYDEDEKIGATQLHSSLSFQTASSKPPVTRSSTVSSSYRRTKRADALERLQGRHFKSFIGLDDDEAEMAAAGAVSESKLTPPPSQKRRRRKAAASTASRSSQTPSNSPTSGNYPHTLPPFKLEDLTLNLAEFEDWLDLFGDEPVSS
jgi:hypothetical protein